VLARTESAYHLSFLTITEASDLLRYIFLLLLLGAATIGLIACNSRSRISSSVTSTPHTATLSWNPSTSAVMGYYVYRGSKSGGPYAKVNLSPVTGTTYTDNAVQSGQTYFYVVTAVDSYSVESALSNEISAIIPSN